MIVNIIVAYCKNSGIGKDNALLWDIKEDMAKFKRLTTGNKNNAIIMGRKTYESLNNVDGLVNRDNLILSKSLNIDKITNKNIVKTFTTIQILEEFVKSKNYDEIWIIGGEQIYNLFLTNLVNKNTIFKINEIIITYIEKEFICTSYFPNLEEYTKNYNLYFYSKNIIKTKDPNINYNIYDIIYKFL
uniref:dihydrofolate reductase n=1 Tax=viral metagenome TaxID=1070528 RepID=A0A6C0H429_9ZZZZ